MGRGSRVEHLLRQFRSSWEGTECESPSKLGELAELQQVTTFPTRPTSDLRAQSSFPRPHHTLCRHPGTSTERGEYSLHSSLCRVSVFMFNSVESCFNNDFIWFTLSTADRQIGDSPKLLKIQEKYRRQ